MKRTAKLTLLMLLAAGSLALLAVGCNEATDDPEVSDNLLTIEAVSPTNACVDVDGEPIDLDGDGTWDTIAVVGVLQRFTIGSRVRGPATTDPVWTDAIVEQVNFTYSMDDGGATPAAWTWRPTSPIQVPSNGRVVAPIDTVRLADVGPGAVFDTAGRHGKIYATFRGTDVTGEPIRELSATIPLVTANDCEAAQ